MGGAHGTHDQSLKVEPTTLPPQPASSGRARPQAAAAHDAFDEDRLGHGTRHAVVDQAGPFFAQLLAGGAQHRIELGQTRQRTQVALDQRGQAYAGTVVFVALSSVNTLQDSVLHRLQHRNKLKTLHDVTLWEERHANKSALVEKDPTLVYDSRY